MRKKLGCFWLVIFMFCVSSLAIAKQDASSSFRGQDTSLTSAVVKIFVTSNEMDYYRPWQSKGSKASAGSGAIIDGKRILTNAHVVSDHTFIQVKKDSDPKKYTARVVAIGHDCDLALLEVEDPRFFDGVIPLEFGSLPKQKDSVTVIGYPQGGGKISITEGVVSRIEITSYAQSSRQLLTVQIDAAINPGNSGGPVIQNKKLVGIAMQVFQSGQNIGYMIPTPIVKHLLKDLGDKRYDGFPLLGVDFKNTENEALREFYGITDKKGGVLVSKVIPFSPAFGSIESGDVIFSINGVDVGEDGTFMFRGSERLSLVHLITREHVGEEVVLKITRDKKDKEIRVRLDSFVPMIPYAHHFEKPPYFILGGFVFTVLSVDLIRSWGGRWWEKAPLDFIYNVLGAGRFNKEAKREVVVLLNVLPGDINVGYHEMKNSIVLGVNGEDVQSFKDFVLAIDQMKNTQPYTIIETEHQASIILNNKNIDATDKEILKRNNIPRQYSSDVAQWLGY